MQRYADRESRSAVSSFSFLSQQNRRLRVLPSSDAARKRQIQCQSDLNPPPSSVHSYRWNQEVAMTTGQVTITGRPPDVHKVLKPSQFERNYYFCSFHCEANQSPVNQPPHKSVFPAVPMTKQFHFYSSSQNAAPQHYCMCSTLLKAVTGALNGLRTRRCGELHTPGCRHLC